MTTSTATPPVGSTLQFEIVKHVTLPHIKLNENGDPNFIRIETPIEKGKELQAGRTRKSADGEETAEQMAPPDLCEILNLQTGELGMMIVNAVIKSNLEEKYPNASYVGKSFQIRRLATIKKGSRKYYTFEILEIRLKEASASANKPATSVHAPTSAKK